MHDRQNNEYGLVMNIIMFLQEIYSESMCLLMADEVPIPYPNGYRKLIKGLLGVEFYPEKRTKPGEMLHFLEDNGIGEIKLEHILDGMVDDWFDSIPIPADLNMEKELAQIAKDLQDSRNAYLDYAFVKEFMAHQDQDDYKKAIQLFKKTKEKDCKLFPELTAAQAYEWMIKPHRNAEDKVACRAYQALLVNSVQKINELIPKVKTSGFLKEEPWFEGDLPEEVKRLKRVYTTDDDRLYWWDGSDEVIISEETVKWLIGLGTRHKELVEEIGNEEKAGDCKFLEEFFQIIKDADTYYRRIFPFRDMFYEFLQNSQKVEYVVAIKLLREIVDAEEHRKSAISWNCALA